MRGIREVWVRGIEEVGVVHVFFVHVFFQTELPPGDFSPGDALSIQSRKTTFFLNDFSADLEVARTILLNHGLKPPHRASGGRRGIGRPIQWTCCDSGGSSRVLSRAPSRRRPPGTPLGLGGIIRRRPLSRRIWATTAAAADKTSALIRSAGLPGSARRSGFGVNID